MELRHILFPIDFSEHCAAFSDYVEAMVRGTGARLTLLHVLECPPSWYSEVDAARMSTLVDLAPMKQHRQEQLKSYLASRFQDLAVSRLLLQGDPATEIVQFAKKEQVSIVALPTRGSGVFRRMLLGSVTAKVLHDAVCPVWTSSHVEHARAARYPYGTVACALDLSQQGEQTLRWAHQFASQQNARLHVVHAIDVNDESTNRGVLEVRRYLCDQAAKQWQSLVNGLGFTAPLHIAYGSVGVAVRKAVADLQADIVIIGRGHGQDVLGSLRTSTYSIIRESGCPVISV